ncbi:MAG: hypothetical protein WAX04_11880 [Oscillospiraceae bacterium]
MMKLKLKDIFKKSLFLLLYSLVFWGIGYVVAILISYQFKYNLQDVLFCEGLGFIMIGAFLSMKGNPSGVNFQGMGQNNGQYISYQNLEVTRIERETTDYYKNFFKHSVVEFAFSGLTIILSGIFIIVFSMFFSK